ncbi:MAG: UvrD-helicase domain-containing protein [Alphaproteobacteria bacterium]|nr:UvrD-helicase domain-containing protein [Alphaproteobacteria bacterium]
MDGPLLVLSGAGTGKTRVLTARLAEILRQRRAYPSQIFAVTFTNKAAAEMRHRVAAMIGDAAAQELWLGTFHALGARILRRHAELVGLSKSFTILDPDDQIRLMKQCLREAKIDEKTAHPRAIVSIINRWKDGGYTPATVPKNDKNLSLHEYSGKGKTIWVRDLYDAYQSRLRQLDACDFGDLLLAVVELFQSQPEILSQYQEKFRFILVDEFQDTNRIQYQLLRLLCAKNQNICCVGDDDQSIYGWRGAEITNILNFGEDFPAAKTIRLEQNYRSTKHILGAASSLIAKNDRRLGKSLWTEYPGGEKVKILSLYDHREEAGWIADEIAALRLEHHPLSEIGILVRTSAQTRGFEESLTARGIPYRVYGGLRFFERQEIRDVIAYLRLINQPADDLAFERIINTPKRGIGATTLESLRLRSRLEQLPLLEVARRQVGLSKSGETENNGGDSAPVVKSAARRALSKFIQSLDLWQERMRSDPPSEFVKFLLQDSGYQAAWEHDPGIEKESRLENLRELVQQLTEFASIAEFLDHVALVMESIKDSGRQQVNIMTLHSSKGLEFQTVFLPGWEEEFFPHTNALVNGKEGEEEERRLAYVGLTRARQRAIVSWVKHRLIWNDYRDRIPSRFIREISAEDADSLELIDGQPYPVTDRGGRLPPSRLDRSPPALTASQRQTAPNQALKVGDRVSHSMFGVGTVCTKEGSHLSVDFGSSFGVKNLIDAYVKKIS